MTATVEPGRAEDWEDTGPIPLYTRTNGDTARWRDRGRIIADLITERDEARAEVERTTTAAEAAIEHANVRRMTAEAEVRDLRAQVAAVERALDDEEANLASDGARLSHSVVRRLRAALASVGRTEPAPEARPPRGGRLR